MTRNTHIPTWALPLLLFLSTPLILPGQTSVADWLDDAAEHRRAARFVQADSLLHLAWPQANDSFRYALLLEQIRIRLDQSDFSRAKTLIDSLPQLLPEGPDDQQQADQLNLLGNLREGEGAFEAARQAYQEALALRVQKWGTNHPEVADLYNNLGNVYYRAGLLEEALVYHRTAQSIRESRLTPPHPDLAGTYNNLAACYYARGEYALALRFYQKARKMREDVYGPDHPLVAASWNNVGNAQLALGAYPQALSAHQRALQLRQISGTSASLAQSYNNLGNTYAALQQEPQAVAAYQQALTLRREIYGSRSVPVAQALANLGNYLLEKGDVGEARTQLEEALLILKDAPPSNILLADVYMNYGRLLSYVDELAEARSYVQRAVDRYQSQLGSRHPRTLEAWNILGNLFAQEADFVHAETFYRKVVTYLSLAQPRDRPALARARYNLGRTYLESRDFAAAETEWQSAGELLSGYTFHPLQWEIKAGLITLYQEWGQPVRARQIWSQNTMPEQLSELAPQAFLEYAYAGVQITGDPQKRLDLARRAIAQLERMVRGFPNRESRQQNLDWQYRWFDAALQACFELNASWPSRGYADTAFLLTEKSRNLVLSGPLALSRQNLPDSAYLQFKQRSARIAELDRLLYESGHTTDSIRRRSWQLERLELAREQRRQQNQWWAPTASQAAKVSLTDLQNAFREKQGGGLSYFLGPKNSFRFFLDGHQVYMDTLSQAQVITGEIIRLQDGIRHFTSAQQQDYYRLYAQNFAQAARQLYRQLLEWPQKLPERLFVFPDGALYYLPFDVLLSADIDTARMLDFHRYSYAVHHHAFSYHHSAARWLQRKSRTSTGSVQWVGMAPLFTGKQEGLPPLRYNAEEISFIADRIGGARTIIGPEATRDRFLREASRADILHLATHGQADARRGLFSFLAFSAADSVRQRLYARELQEVDLTAALVVLSACETGLGNYRQGEGVISLTRALQDAGAASTLTTLWRIDDEKSRILMGYFYEGLRQKMPKDQALQYARKTYLAEYRSAFAHPFYWAAFMAQGDMHAVSLPRVWPVRGLLFATVFLAVFLLFVRFRKKIWAIRS